MPVTIPATGTGTATPIVATDNITADSSQVQIVELAGVSGGVLSRVAVTASAVNIGGDTAHDAVDAGSPIKLGGYAKAAAPTAVTADGDRVNAWFQQTGQLMTTLVSSSGATIAVVGNAADAVATSPGLATRSANVIYNGATWDMERSIASLDAAPNVDTGLLAVGVGPGWDRQRDPANLGTVIGNTSAINVNGADIITVAVMNATTGTFTIEATADGTNFVAPDMIDLSTGLWVSGTNITPAIKTYKVRAGGMRQIRLKTVATLGATLQHKFTGHVGHVMPIEVGSNAAALVDALSSPITSSLGAFLHAYNGTTWDRLRSANTGKLLTDEQGSAVLATGQVTPTATAATLIAQRLTRKSITFYNGTNMVVYVGPATVTTGNGLAIQPGASWTPPTTALIQNIVSTVTGLTGVVSYAEYYD